MNSRRISAKPEVGQRAPGTGRWWLLIVFGLLGMNLSIVGATVFFALGDPTVATEPEYYAKAIAYDRTALQREASKRLCWSAVVTVHRAESGGSAKLELELRTAEGQPVSGALVRVVAFASLRARQRQVLELEERAASPGVYSAPIEIGHAGWWQFRVSATRAEELFLVDIDQVVAPRQE